MTEFTLSSNSDWQHVDGVRYPHVIERECVGGNLRYLICPSPVATTMKWIDAGGLP